MNELKDTEARVNITFGGKNGDLRDPVFFQSTDGDVKNWVTEAVRAGSVPGLEAAPTADFGDFVIDRFAASEARPYNLIQVRPKTPFGFASCAHCTACVVKRLGRGCCGCGKKQRGIAFDIGGVLSKYPDKFRPFIVQLLHGGIEVFVITDMHDVEKIYEMLVMNDFGMIPKSNVYSADYKEHGDGCKAELLRELEIDLFFDDHLPYMMLPGDTIQALVMPTAFKPYWSPEWKVPEGGDSEFGRRFYKKGWPL